MIFYRSIEIYLTLAKSPILHAWNKFFSSLSIYIEGRYFYF